MLSHLSIRNIVLIDACDIVLTRGLCVLTGETGAGKSILLDALGLALGARSDSGLVRQGQPSGSVTAEFDISGNARAQEILNEFELAITESVLIRRTLAADGKTRCFVNDEPVSVTTLKKLGETLIEVHGQHDQRGLMESVMHRGLLDAYGAYPEIVKAVAEAHAAWQAAEAELHTLTQEIEQSKKEEEYLRHMAAELAKLAPEQGEEESLSQTRAEMMQSEKLFTIIDDALSTLGKDQGPSMTLRAAQRVLMRSSLHASGQFSEVIDALERAAEEADRAEEQLDALAKAATYNPQTLEQLEDRLFALKAAARKYGVSVDELSGLQENAEQKLKRLDSRERDLNHVTKAVMEAKKQYREQAEKLTAARKKAALKIEKVVLAELSPLKMGGTQFHVRMDALPESAWSAHGMEAVAFEVATNVAKGGTPVFSPLSKIASGGELSRFMLAFKVALSEVRSTPTLIFDEIDTGTGGAVADAIGQRLSVLAEEAQVLVVTHLPQVAARGRTHLRVQKTEKKGAVFTTVETLSDTERKEELARMLAGAKVTAEARRAAEKLLEDAA